MIWEIEFTDEFGVWWDLLSDAEHESIRASVKLLVRDKPPVSAFERC